MKNRRSQLSEPSIYTQSRSFILSWVSRKNANLIYARSHPSAFSKPQTPLRIAQPSRRKSHLLTPRTHHQPIQPRKRPSSKPPLSRLLPSLPLIPICSLHPIIRNQNPIPSIQSLHPHPLLHESRIPRQRTIRSHSISNNSRNMRCSHTRPAQRIYHIWCTDPGTYYIYSGGVDIDARSVV